MITILSNSPEETTQAGAAIAERLHEGDVLCLTGDLGAGKTTFVKGLVQKISGVDSNEITSPTFTYMNIYRGPSTVYHFDLYRLSSQEAFFLSGFQEFLGQKHFCCVEWPEKLPPDLVFKRASVHIEYLSPLTRKITFEEASHDS